MGNTFVHGYVNGEQQAQGLVRALLGAGFPGRDIELSREAPSARPLSQVPLRRNALRDMGAGAVCGALAFAPLGPVLPHLVAQPGTPARVWALVSETPLGATLEVGVLGALCGALVGIGVGAYRARRAVERSARYFVGVHTGEEKRSRAFETMQQRGPSELVAENE
jgi:hypothetical protein